MLALLAVPFVDELASGVAPASAPEIAHDLALPGGWVAGGIVTAFYGLALLETPLLAWSERVSARWFSTGSLAVLALATLGAALAGSPLTLALALAAYGPASGCALSIAEGVLVESRPAERERTMARVTLAAAIGDLSVPLVIAGLAAAGIGWRGALVVAGMVAAVLAVSHAASPGLDRAVPTDDEDEDEAPTIVEALRTALGTRALLGWSLAGTLGGLLDEVLVAFVAVHLAPLPSLARSIALAAWIAGGIAGLAWLERRIDRISSRRVLFAGGGICALALGALAGTRDPWLAPALLAVVGATSATFHPLLKARAYASLPGRPALVNAVASALVPLDAAAPLVIGVVAASLGSAAAVLVLAAAPCGIAWAAWRSADR